LVNDFEIDMVDNEEESMEKHRIDLLGEDDDEISKSRVWKGSLMGGIWDGKGNWILNNQTWTGQGTWEGDGKLLFGNWHGNGEK